MCACMCLPFLLQDCRVNSILKLPGTGKPPGGPLDVPFGGGSRELGFIQNDTIKEPEQWACARPLNVDFCLLTKISNSQLGCVQTTSSASVFWIHSWFYFRFFPPNSRSDFLDGPPWIFSSKTPNFNQKIKTPIFFKKPPSKNHLQNHKKNCADMIAICLQTILGIFEILHFFVPPDTASCPNRRSECMAPSECNSVPQSTCCVLYTVCVLLKQSILCFMDSVHQTLLGLCFSQRIKILHRILATRWVRL